MGTPQGQPGATFATAAASGPGQWPGVTTSRWVPAQAHTRPSATEQALAAAALFLLLSLNVGLMSLAVASVPVRSIVGAAFLAVLALAYPKRVSAALHQHRRLLWLAVSLAFIGIFVSLANGTSLAEIVRGVAEVPLQIVVTLLAASVLSNIAGARASVSIFIAVVAASAFIALLQFFKIDAAYQLRELLGPFPKADESGFSESRVRRPMGLSYSPIQLSTQLCVAFAVFAAARERSLGLPGARVPADPLILIGLFLMCLGSFATGTRSPILGAVLFFAIYALRRPGSWLLLLGGLAAAALYLIGPAILSAFETAQPRIVMVNDNSASSRSTLFYYGVLLFIDNPLGYGYDFTPSDHWMKFWDDLYQRASPLAVTVVDLHNYPLSMLNTYGIGILLVMPLVFKLLMQGRHAAIFFVPYIVHIMFHNSGPFWNDIPFWIAIAALTVAASHSRNQGEHRVGRQEDLRLQ